MVAWLFILLSLLGSRQSVDLQVDICELNHHLAPNGVVIVSQWIWWKYDWTPKYGWDYYVKGCRLERVVPYPVNNRQEWIEPLPRRKIGITHKVFRETWTNYDREFADQRRWLAYERWKF